MSIYEAINEVREFINSFDKRKLALILIIILAIVAFVFYFKKDKAPSGPPPSASSPTGVFKIGDDYFYIPETKESCAQKKSESEKQRCLDEIALRDIIKNGDYKECFNLKTAEIKNECLFNLISQGADSSLCATIPDKEKAEKCIDRIVVLTKDSKHCDYFNNAPLEKQECQDRALAFKIAESGRTDDILECRKIKTLEYPNLCLNNSIKNKFNNDCTGVPDEIKDYCMAVNLVAVATSESDCLKINIENYKKFCLIEVALGNDIKIARKVDSDNDGLTDSNELFTSLDPYDSDTDKDGLFDGDEYIKYNTNPKDADTDGDGYTDGEEVKNGTNPTGQ
jgi:hypothetical protein